MPTVEHECTRFFIGLQTMIRSHGCLSHHICNFNTSMFARTYSDVITMKDIEIRYHVIHSWWLFSNVALEEGLLGLWSG